MKQKKQKKLNKLVKTQLPDKLKKKADKLYQDVYKKKYPRSIVSGKPTQVIHHFIHKSQSNNLRYDEDNAIPLTISEHDKLHHHKSGSEIVLQIVNIKGKEWQEKLLKKSKITRKLTNDYLEEVIKEFKKELE